MVRKYFEYFEAENANQISPEIKQIILQEHKTLTKKQIKELLKDGFNSQEFLLAAEEMAQEQKQVERSLFSPKLFVSDATPIGFLKILTENQGVVNILDPEPRVLHDFIKDPRMLDLLLSGYTDEPFSYHHAYKEYSFDSLCINTCIMCQPNEAQKFIENAKLSDRGLLCRFLPIFSNQTWENKYNISQDLAEFYKSKIQSLLEYFSFKEHIFEFSLTEEAQHLLQTIQFLNTQNIEPYNSFMSKIKGLIVRLALAIHLWNFKGDNDSFEVTLAEIQDAITIVHAYVLPNAQFMYGRYNLKVYKNGYKILQRLYDISEPERYKIYNGILVSELKRWCMQKALSSMFHWNCFLCIILYGC